MLTIKDILPLTKKNNVLDCLKKHYKCDSLEK